MYEIGDRIVYPMHGAGVIETIEDKFFLGNLKSYYVLKIGMRDMKVMIPVEGVGEIGIRKVVCKGDIEKIFLFLCNNISCDNINWNKRYRENMLKIRSGDVYEVADVYKSLMIRDQEKGLSTGERKMLATARQILLSELVLAGDMSLAETESKVRACLGY